MKFIVGVICGFTFGTCAIYIMMSARPKPADPMPRASAQYASNQFIFNYRNGLAKAYDEIADQIESGAITNFEDIARLLPDVTTRLRDESGEDMKMHMMKIYGDQWDKGLAEITFRQFADGFRKNAR